jgi:DNA polymerase I-like protein with 3'-5' exonuclease and polymerase domains
MFPPVSDWKAPNVSDLPSWKGQKYVGLDTEFEDPTLSELGLGARRGVKVAGYSFAFMDGRKYYVPVRHPEGNVENPEHGLAKLRDEAKDFDGELVGANLPTELDILAYEPTGKILFPKVKAFRDVQIAAPILHELYHTYNLEVIAERLGLPGKDESMLKRAAQDYGADISKRSWKAIVPKLPAKYVGPYGEHDAFLPLQILALQLKQLEEAGLLECFDLYSQALLVLLKMRQRGVAISFDQLDLVERNARATEIAALNAIHHITGVRISPGDTMKLGAVVPAFEAIGIAVPQSRDAKTGNLKYSVDKEFLASVDHPVATHLRDARQAGKLYGTFVDSIRSYQVNGRIHCTLRAIVGAGDNNEESGAAFGRLSCVDPNLQQQPQLMRSVFVPEPGCIWGCLDYAAQEPRWTTHFAAKLKLRGAAQAAAEYCSNPKVDPHGLMAKLTGLPRKYAKIIFLGLCYGEGGAKLCGQLGLPTRWAVRYRDSGTVEYFDSKPRAAKARREYEGEASFYEVAGEEGQKILDTFNERVPFVRELAKRAEKRAREVGKIQLLGGRVLNFPQDDKGSYDFTYKALNRLIQGTAGMQMLSAMIEIDRQYPNEFISLQVHDELDGSFESIADAKKIAKIMRHIAGDTHVPFRVDIEVGKDWGNLTQVCGLDHCHNLMDPDFEVWNNFVDAKPLKETYYCEHHTDLRNAA